MSDFEEFFSAKPKAAPKVDEIETFVGEDFSAENGFKEPLPDPNQSFDEFRVKRKSISEMMAEAPSLDSLFQPFAFDEPDADFNKFIEEAVPPVASNFVFEELDCRDPDVIRTLSQAEEEKARILKEAESKLAEAEAQGQVALKSVTAQAEGQAATILEKAQLAAGQILEEAALARRLAEDAQEASEALRLEAEKIKAETEKIYEEAELKIKTCEEEKNQKLAELEKLKEENRLFTEKNLLEATQQGHKEGFAKGEAEGRAKGEAVAKLEFQNKVAGLITALEKVDALYQDLWQANEPMMLKLAIEASEQIVNKELHSAKDLAKHAFSACIEYLAQAHKVVFSARPEDIAQLEEARLAERNRLGGLLKITFKADPALGPGDLIMESDVGRVDATIKNRSDKVLSVLRKAFEDNYLSSTVELFEEKPIAAPAEISALETPLENVAADIPPLATGDETLESASSSDALSSSPKA